MKNTNRTLALIEMVLAQAELSLLERTGMKAKRRTYQQLRLIQSMMKDEWHNNVSLNHVKDTFFRVNDMVDKLASNASIRKAEADIPDAEQMELEL